MRLDRQPLFEAAQSGVRSRRRSCILREDRVRRRARKKRSPALICRCRSIRAGIIVRPCGDPFPYSRPHVRNDSRCVQTAERVIIAFVAGKRSAVCRSAPAIRRLALDDCPYRTNQFVAAFPCGCDVEHRRQPADLGGEGRLTGGCCASTTTLTDFRSHVFGGSRFSLKGFEHLFDARESFVVVIRFHHGPP